MCFTKPQDVVFKDRRYFCEPYPHRWVVRDAQDSTAGAGWDSLGVLRHPDKVNGVDRWVGNAARMIDKLGDDYGSLYDCRCRNQ